MIARHKSSKQLPSDCSPADAYDESREPQAMSISELFASYSNISDDPRFGEISAARRKQLPEGDAHEKIDAAIRHYFEAVEGLGVLSAVAIGTGPGDGRNYLWNVLPDTFRSRDIPSPEFREVGMLAYNLKQELRGVLALRVSDIRQSKVHDLKRRCEDQKITLTLVPLGK